MISDKQEQNFILMLSLLEQSMMLQHIMVVGSFVEQVYAKSGLLSIDNLPDIQTKDMDFLVVNLRKPPERSSLFELMKQHNFTYRTHPLSDITKFEFPDGDMTVEFLIDMVGEGRNDGQPVESLGFSVIPLRHMNILKDNPVTVDFQDYKVLVPLPEAYMLHKIFINNRRLNPEKKEKDLNSVRFTALSLPNDTQTFENIRNIWSKLTKKEKKEIQNVMATNRVASVDDLMGKSLDNWTSQIFEKDNLSFVTVS